MLLTNAIVLLCLGAIWKTSDPLNLLMKFGIFALGIWNFAAYLR